MKFCKADTKRSRIIESTSPRYGEVAAATERGCRVLRYKCVICLIDNIMFKLIRKRMELCCLYMYICVYMYARGYVRVCMYAYMYSYTW